MVPNNTAGFHSTAPPVDTTIDPTRITKDSEGIALLLQATFYLLRLPRVRIVHADVLSGVDTLGVQRSQHQPQRPLGLKFFSEQKWSNCSTGTAQRHEVCVQSPRKQL